MTPERESELLDRSPPHDLEAERGVVGSCLLQPAMLDEVASVVRVEDFYSAQLGKLFGHLVAMSETSQPIDVTLLVNRLRACGELEAIGGAAAIAEAMHAAPIAHHVMHYARLVRAKAELRGIIHAATQLLRDAYMPGAVADDLLVEAESTIHRLSQDRGAGEPVTMMQACLAAQDIVQESLNRKHGLGLATGLPVYDESFGGLFPGELVILAARPSVGKTALACQIALHCAARGRGVYFASAEMTAAELVLRPMCGEADVSNRHVRTGRITNADQAALCEVGNRMAGLPLWIHDHAGIGVSEIRRAARRRVRDGLAMVVVDYLQRLHTPASRKQRYEVVGEMTAGLKDIARELRVPVLCLCQLNRMSETDRVAATEKVKSRKPADKPEWGPPGEPGLRHLYESGRIEQDADVVLFLHRDLNGPVPGKKSQDDKRWWFSTDAKLLTAKNRNGEVGSVRLRFDPPRTRFECIDAPGGAGAWDEFAAFA
jgi:replicative DNA helicase